MRAAALIAATLVLAAPATAQWVEHTAAWQAQGLQGDSDLVADPTGETLYYVFYTSVLRYDPAGDSWTDLLASADPGVLGHRPWKETAFVPVGPAGRILCFNDHAQVDVYDVASNHWSRSPLPTAGHDFSWGQGGFYNPSTGLFWCFWTDNVGTTHELVGAPYDPETAAWGAVWELRHPEDAYWGRMKSVSYGTTNFSMSDDAAYVGRHVTMRRYDLAAAPPFPVPEPTQHTSSHDLGPDGALAAGAGGATAAFGTRPGAVVGNEVVLTGIQGSAVTVAYRPSCDTWRDLPPRPGDLDTSGYRSHSTAAADGVLYVRDGSQFWSLRLRLLADGFESGDTTGWSGGTPTRSP